MSGERSKRWLLPTASFGLNAVVLVCGFVLLMSSADAVTKHEGPGDDSGSGGEVGDTPEEPGNGGAGGGDKSKDKDGSKDKLRTKGGEAPPDDKDAPLADALEKIKDAELEFDGKPVAIPKATVETLLKWGNPAKEGFKFSTTKKLIKTSGFVIDCGKKVGYMGLCGDYYIVAAPEADGIAVSGVKGRLVVFVPLDDDGVGTPKVVKGVDKEEGGMGYYNDPPGYFLVSKTRRKIIKKGE